MSSSDIPSSAINLQNYINIADKLKKKFMGKIRPEAAAKAVEAAVRRPSFPAKLYYKQHTVIRKFHGFVLSGVKSRFRS